MNPPRLIEKFLHWTLPNELKVPILGDLAEEYVCLAAQTLLKANYWYTRQALCTSLQFLTKTKRGLIMFLLGIIIFVGMTLMAMVMSGEIMMFVNVPSFLIVVPPALILTFASSSKQSRSNAFRVLFSENLNLSREELIAAKQLYTTFGNMNMLMGCIGVVIGAIAMASNIEAKVFSQVFGPAFAVCVLPLLYALLIKTLCYGAEAKIQFKIINMAS
jgi:flagellar motor component MotA